jgi:hypothetical protein
MANPRKRPGRGFTFNYLAMTIAVVSSNLNRIVTFFVAEAKRASTDQVLHRARRRKNEYGTRAHPAEKWLQLARRPEPGETPANKFTHSR